MLGIIVAGGTNAIDGLGAPDDAALTPFAGKYRFLDFALATLANSGVRPVYLIAAGAGAALRAHLTGAGRARGDLRRPVIVPLASTRAASTRRIGRLRHALIRARELVRTHRPETVAVLLADHILQLDLRHVHAAHRSLGADVTLAALPLPEAEARGRLGLAVRSDRTVSGISPAGDVPIAPGTPGLALTWAGDLILRADALGAVLAAAARDDADFLDALAGELRVVAYDVLDGGTPGSRPERVAYWHEPDTLEAYYDAQMELCTPHPALDLYNPAWPILPIPSGLGPAKVAADRVGHMGQALNALLADGVVIRGGAAVNSIVGHGVVIESTAEVLDSILLDGCRIGRGARVRRAVIGAGAVVPDEEEIGYERAPVAPARLSRSGLVLVPAPQPLLAAAAH
jgi:glucose-1-phosphate adenylyltransferase